MTHSYDGADRRTEAIGQDPDPDQLNPFIFAPHIETKGNRKNNEAGNGPFQNGH